MPDEKTLTHPVEAPEEKPETPETPPKPKDEVELIEDIKEVKTEEYSDDEVIVSKADLKKLQEVKENYRKGMLSAKDTLKQKVEKPTILPPQGTEYITKIDFYKSVEKDAVSKACEDDVINDNWKDIVANYSPRRGRDTVKSILADIDDAKTLWEKTNPPTEEGNKKVISDQAVEAAKPAGKTKGKQETNKKRTILGQPTPVKEWYGKKEDT